jgi:Arm domain-containing DNA-binding protein
MPLTDVKARTAKPREKAYKLADEKGLFLFITPIGSKYWRFKYRFAGKEKKLAFGGHSAPRSQFFLINQINFKTTKQC